MSIYVVDDHPLMRDVIAMMLRRLLPQESVVELACLADLLPIAIPDRLPRLVWLDLNLPDTTGCSGIRRVRARFPDARLAVYSASRASDVAQECIGAGADIYLEKTIGSRDVAAALHRLMSGSPPPAPWTPHDRAPGRPGEAPRGARLPCAAQTSIGLHRSTPIVPRERS
jgi:DNA-binding NarL/FixJ family response regulator